MKYVQLDHLMRPLARTLMALGCATAVVTQLPTRVGHTEPLITPEITSSRAEELVELGQSRARLARVLFDLRVADRMFTIESWHEAVQQLGKVPSAYPLALDAQRELVQLLERELRSERPNWDKLLAIVEVGTHSRVEHHEFVVLLEGVLTFPRQEKTSGTHGRCLRAALRAAGNTGTQPGVNLLTSATTLEFWEKAGPVRTEAVSTDPDIAVQILRLNAISAMANAPMEIAGPILESIRNEYDSQRSLVGLPQSQSRFEHWAAPNAERALETITFRETPVVLEYIDPKPNGHESEKLHALRSTGELRVDTAANRLRVRIFSPEIDWSLKSEIAREMHAARMTPMSAEDCQFIGSIIDRELAKRSPDWPLVRDALRASLYGATLGDDFARLIRKVLEHPRTDSMCDAHAQSLVVAISAAGYNGTSAAVELLREAATRDFWEANGAPKYPEHLTPPPHPLGVNFQPDIALMQDAIDSLAHAPSELTRPVLNDIVSRYKGLGTGMNAKIVRKGIQFEVSVAHQAEQALRFAEIREGELYTTTDSPGQAHQGD